MIIDLETKDLISLIKGYDLDYSEFNNSLVKKAGYLYDDIYGNSRWENIKSLSDEELYELFLICKTSRNKWI